MKTTTYIPLPDRVLRLSECLGGLQYMFAETHCAYNGYYTFTKNLLGKTEKTLVLPDHFFDEAQEYMGETYTTLAVREYARELFMQAHSDIQWLHDNGFTEQVAI